MRRPTLDFCLGGQILNGSREDKGSIHTWVIEQGDLRADGAATQRARQEVSIAFRRAYGVSICGLFKKSLCAVLLRDFLNNPQVDTPFALRKAIP